MTYARFLLLFLCLPTAGLAVAMRRRLRRYHLIALALVSLLAFVYTAPWDNFAARVGLWSFAPQFVWGRPYWYGHLPLEEYLFYFAETLFVCLAAVALSRVRFLRPEDG